MSEREHSGASLEHRCLLRGAQVGQRRLGVRSQRRPLGAASDARSRRERAQRLLEKQLHAKEAAENAARPAGCIRAVGRVEESRERAARRLLHRARVTVRLHRLEQSTDHQVVVVRRRAVSRRRVRTGLHLVRTGLHLFRTGLHRLVAAGVQRLDGAAAGYCQRHSTVPPFGAHAAACGGIARLADGCRGACCAFGGGGSILLGLRLAKNRAVVRARSFRRLVSELLVVTSQELC
mmetsp:Transcript_853/g.1833  ORF Transcript_853/g.1833 Transcript_853/m.1833 type:complete len:235 (+) Transcript_853:122-826(+)